MGNRISQEPSIYLKSPETIQNRGQNNPFISLPVRAEPNKIKIVLRLNSLESIAYISLQARKDQETVRDVLDSIFLILKYSSFALQLPEFNEIACRILKPIQQHNILPNAQETLYSLAPDTHLDLYNTLTFDQNAVYSVIVISMRVNRKYLYQGPEIANELVESAELILLPCRWRVEANPKPTS